MNIKKIIRYPYKIIREFLFYYKTFGFLIAINKVLCMCAEHIPNFYIKNFIYKRKHTAILNYLSRKYRIQLNEISAKVSKMSSVEVDNYAIWQCWWQGEDKLSGITKMCVNSVKYNSDNTPVNFVTLQNFSNYIQLPSFILEKYRQGYISLTEMSDILRVKLLWKYGGLWIDATVLVNDKIINKIKENKFFTCSEPCHDKMFVSDYRWNTSFMGGKANLPLFAFVSMMFDVYWENEKQLIDYYLLDYLIALGYNNVSSIKSDIDSVSFNNVQKHKLQNFLNNSFDKGIWENLTKDTCIFKLSRKLPKPYVEYAGDRQTFYGYLCNKYMSN